MACSRAGTLAVLLLCETQACTSAPRTPAPLVSLEGVGVGAVEVYGPGLVGTNDAGSAVTFALTASASAVLVRVWPGLRLEQLYPLRSKDSTYFQTGLHTLRIPAPTSPTLTGRQLASAPVRHLSAVEQAAFDQCVWQEARRRQRPPPSAARDSARRGRPAPAPGEGPVDYGAIEAWCAGTSRNRPATEPAGRRSVVPAGQYLVLVVSDHVQDARHLRMRLGAVDITRSSLASVLQVLPEFLAGADAKTWAGYVAQVPPPARPVARRP
jgi:hypothetical protein